MGVARFQHGKPVGRKRDLLATITATETLVIVGVVLLLAAVLVPTIRSQLAVTGILQARYEIEQLHAGFMRFYHDNGHMPSSLGSAPQAARGSARASHVTTLITNGDLPMAEHDPQCTGWVRANSDYVSHHLIDNAAGYAPRNDDGHGWNGPYLDHPIGPDPWGRCYMVNIAWFNDNKSANDKNERAKRAVFIISAGPDGRIDTPWSQPITTAQARGDDVTLRLQ